MMYTCCAILASFFVFAAFILELWVMIGQLSTRPFIQWINFCQVTNHSNQQSYTFNLWNYCTQQPDGNLAGCQHPTAAYNWANAPFVQQALPDIASKPHVAGLFYALFILYFIGMIWSFLLWLSSLPMCCIRRRGASYCMAPATVINFFIMLVALILALVAILRGLKLLTDADNNWTGRAGWSLWMTIGAVISLLLASLCYCCTGARGGGRSMGRVGDTYKA